jgi:hypothetical protein
MIAGASKQDNLNMRWPWMTKVLQTLAQPLDPPLREPFYRSVASELSRYQTDEIGPGWSVALLHRCSVNS